MYRILTTILLAFTSFTFAHAQAPPQFSKVGDVNFTQADGPITVTKLLDRQTKLLIVNSRTFRVVDVATGAVIKYGELDLFHYGEDNPRVISPDGRRVLVFGNYDSKDKHDKVKRPAAIWDLESGKKIAQLDNSARPVRAALWSRDGKTLATSSDKYAPFFTDDRSIEVAFWDGETFKFLSSLPADKINWWHLNDDGSKCLFSTAPIVNWLYIMRFIGDRGGPINVWDTRSGRMDQTLSVSQTDALINTRATRVSPDGRLLAYIADKPKSKDFEKRLVVREIGDGPSNFHANIKYEIEPSPKFSDYGVHFSNDGAYFGFDAGKTLQIYETASGQKKFELKKDEVPNYWLNDNKILLYGEGDELVGRDIQTGNELYRQKVILSYGSYYANTEDVIPTTVVYDSTTVVPHPNGKTFLTYSHQYVKVHDALTGAVLQTLVEPQIDPNKRPDPKKGPRLSDKALVKSAAWSLAGDGVHVISYDEKTVSFWKTVDSRQ